MPSGVVHDRITIWILPWVVGITYCLTRSAELTLILAGGYLFSGMMFGPDLDIRSIQYKRWGIIRGIWLPYRRFLRHRSAWSHGFLLGTFVRLIYFLLIVALFAIVLVGIAQLFVGFDWNWQTFVRQQFRLLIKQYPRETISLFCGLEIGAMSHSISDWINSSRKRRLKNKLNKPVKQIRKRRKAKVKIYQQKR